MTSPISPSPITAYRPNDLPAYVSNGWIGLRVREIPLRNGVAILNGYSGKDPTVHVEATTRAPYPLGADLQLGQIWLSEAPLSVTLERQSYDFSCGELHSAFTFAAEGVRAHIQVLTFCSRSLPTLALQEITVEVDAACDLALRCAVDPTGIPGRMVARTVRTPGASEQEVDGSLRWESLGGISACGVAYTTELPGQDVQPTYDEWHEQGPLMTTYTLHVTPHTRYILRQITSMVPSMMHHSPDQQAARMAWLGRDRGFERVRQENRDAWADLWRGRIHLCGAERKWQAMADAAFYYLHASVHPSSPSATAPFGLATWYNDTYYYGHIMWDLETFTYPALVLTYPPAAHAMLEYRAQRLPDARSNARMYGYSGIQFPWESSSSSGDESAPVRTPHTVYEQHTSLDVAFAFAQYAYATGDQGYLHDAVWPVLDGVAQWITSRATNTARGYEILQMTGPSEEKGPVNNDAYVNMAATVVLHAAIECAQQLGHQPPTEWEHIADRLVIPQNSATRVILNYDGYTPDQPGGATPSAAAGLYPLNYPADPAVERATLAFYVDLAQKYIGKPMLSALYGVFAARLGDRKRALELLEKGYGAFIQEPFSNPGEMPADPKDKPHAGPFFANLGGFLMDCLYGLPGLRLGPGEPQSWCERPVVLPTGWESIEVDRIWVRGQPAHLVARHGDEHARIEVQPSAE